MADRGASTDSEENMGPISVSDSEYDLQINRRHIGIHRMDDSFYGEPGIREEPAESVGPGLDLFQGRWVFYTDTDMYHPIDASKTIGSKLLSPKITYLISKYYFRKLGGFFLACMAAHLVLTLYMVTDRRPVLLVPYLTLSVIGLSYPILSITLYQSDIALMNMMHFDSIFLFVNTCVSILSCADMLGWDVFTIAGSISFIAYYLSFVFLDAWPFSFSYGQNVLSTFIEKADTQRLSSVNLAQMASEAAHSTSQNNSRPCREASAVTDRYPKRNFSLANIGYFRTRFSLSSSPTRARYMSESLSQSSLNDGDFDRFRTLTSSYYSCKTVYLKMTSWYQTPNWFFERVIRRIRLLQLLTMESRLALFFGIASSTYLYVIMSRSFVGKGDIHNVAFLSSHISVETLFRAATLNILAFCWKKAFIYTYRPAKLQCLTRQSMKVPLTKGWIPLLGDEIFQEIEKKVIKKSTRTVSVVSEEDQGYGNDENANANANANPKIEADTFSSQPMALRNVIQFSMTEIEKIDNKQKRYLSLAASGPGDIENQIVNEPQTNGDKPKKFSLGRSVPPPRNGSLGRVHNGPLEGLRQNNGSRSSFSSALRIIYERKSPSPSLRSSQSAIPGLWLNSSLGRIVLLMTPIDENRVNSQDETLLHSIMKKLGRKPIRRLPKKGHQLAFLFMVSSWLLFLVQTMSGHLRSKPFGLVHIAGFLSCVYELVHYNASELLHCLYSFENWYSIVNSTIFYTLLYDYTQYGEWIHFFSILTLYTQSLRLILGDAEPLSFSVFNRRLINVADRIKRKKHVDHQVLLCIYNLVRILRSKLLNQTIAPPEKWMQPRKGGMDASLYIPYDSNGGLWEKFSGKIQLNKFFSNGRLVHMTSSVLYMLIVWIALDSNVISAVNNRTINLAFVSFDSKGLMRSCIFNLTLVQVRRIVAHFLDPIRCISSVRPVIKMPLVPAIG